MWLYIHINKLNIFLYRTVKWLLNRWKLLWWRLQWRNMDTWFYWPYSIAWMTQNTCLKKSLGLVTFYYQYFISLNVDNLIIYNSVAYYLSFVVPRFQELKTQLLELSQNIHGKKVLIYLLSPRDPHYIHPDIINILKTGDGNETR